ncbi:Oidioi.mRNA.OKI2018_I69.XSR.g13443.t1.cds [Oikopleura dioica]|uniref:Large ribosomal subunit protein mL62 n=1 Tax=Oikopleura dioica TaxID=34765 RepID=A0ABN7S6W3_OIKDI|nr:Oidioi.mRNA.OKI2018_I69.XSR.g13443.t1.cds [Oikopleura dioica]
MQRIATVRSLIKIPRDTVNWKKFAAAKGRGGQHVNRNDTAVEVRFSIDEEWISAADRSVLKRDFGHLISKKSEIVLIESKHREPLRNFEKALRDFEEKVNPALEQEESEIALKRKRYLENHNPKKLEKANKKRLKDKRLKKYSKNMRKITHKDFQLHKGKEKVRPRRQGVTLPCCCLLRWLDNVGAISRSRDETFRENGLPRRRRHHLLHPFPLSLAQLSPETKPGTMPAPWLLYPALMEDAYDQFQKSKIKLP